MHSVYITENVIPNFGKWVGSFTTNVSMSEAKKNGRMFLKNYVDVGMVENRGEVYECFEDLATHAEMALQLGAGQEQMKYENMCTLAKGIVWAVEHDGFDVVKYDTLTQWGEDIANAM